MNVVNIASRLLSTTLTKTKRNPFMSDIQISQVRRLDFTQLLVMSSLMRHRKLTLVASEIGLTQSAISHILKRLRETFQDELFLRRPAGIEPTARAVSLEPIVNEILSLTTSALQLERTFDPMVEKRIVRISGPDVQMALYMPPMIALFAEQAPGIRISFTSQTRETALESLNVGQVDLSISFFWDVPKKFDTQKLYREDYLIVMRHDHSLARGEVSLDAYCDADHLLVSARGDLEGIVDNTLAGLGRTRHVSASVAQFFPALATVASSNLITTIPSRLARRYCEQFGLACKEVPFAIRPFQVSAVWHRRTTSDPALAWVRKQLIDLTV